MFSLRIRRSLSSLLITSILSSSLSPAFATLINNDDDNPEPATSTAQTKTSKEGSPSVLNLMMTLETNNPCWNALYAALSPATRNALGQVSKLAHEAQKSFDRNQVMRITPEGLAQLPNLTKRFGQVVVEEAVNTNSPTDQDLIYTIGDRTSKIGNSSESAYDFSKATYVDVTLKNFETLRDLLANAHKAATLHVSLNDTMDRDTLAKLRDLFPLQHATSKTDSSALRKSNSPFLRKLNSLRVVADSAATAISFLEWWSSHLRIGDQNNTDARPHLQIFIDQITRDFKFSGEVSSSLDWDIKFAGAADPRKVAAEISRSEQDRLAAFEAEFINFNAFLNTFHSQENAADALGGVLRKQSLLRVLSYADIFEGVSIDSRPITIPGIIYPNFYPTSKHNLPLVQQFYEGQSVFAERQGTINSFNSVQPTTLVNCLALVSSEFSEFEDTFRAKLLRALIDFPTFNRVAAVQAVKKIAALGEKIVMPILHYLSIFNRVDYNSIVELFSGLLSTMTSPAENASGAGVQEESPVEKLFGHLRNNRRVIQEMPPLQRFGALRSTVSFLREQADLTSIKAEHVGVVLKAFGSLPSDAARDELSEFLKVNLPSLKDMDTYAYIAIASAVPADQRIELIPLVYKVCEKMIKEGELSWQVCFDVAQIIGQQDSQARESFCKNLEKIVRGLSNSEDVQTTIGVLIKKVKPSDRGDILEKTAKCFEDEKCYFGHKNLIPYLILSLLTHNDKLSEVFDLVINYAPATGLDRFRVFESLKGLPLEEIRTLLLLLKSLGDHSDSFGTDKAKAIRSLKTVPAQYRPLVVDLADITNQSPCEVMDRLEKARAFYDSLQKNLGKFPFEVQAKTAQALKRFPESYSGEIFANFETLAADEDPVEIAEVMNLFYWNFETVQRNFTTVHKFPKGERKILAQEIMGWTSNISKHPENPLKLKDALFYIAEVDPKRVSSVLKNAKAIVKEHPVTCYDIKEILKELVKLPEGDEGAEIAQAYALAWSSGETKDLCFQSEKRFQALSALPRGQRIAVINDVNKFVATYKEFNQNLSALDVVKSLADIEAGDLSTLFALLPPSAQKLSFNDFSMPKIFKGFAKTPTLAGREDLVQAELIFVAGRDSWRGYVHTGFEELLTAPVGNRALCANYVRSMTGTAQLSVANNLQFNNECIELYATLCEIPVQDWEAAVTSVNAKSTAKLQEGAKADPIHALKEAVRRLKLEKRYPTK